MTKREGLTQLSIAYTRLASLEKDKDKKATMLQIAQTYSELAALET